MRKRYYLLSTLLLAVVVMLAGCGSHNPPTSYPDADGDGAPNFVEIALGTDPHNTNDYPGLHGQDFVIMPYGSAPEGGALTLTPAVASTDCFILMDITGSMGEALNNIKSSLAGVLIPGIKNTIQDSALGVGAYADFPLVYGTTGDQPFFLYCRPVTLTSPNGVNFVSNAVSTITLKNGYDNPESSWEALHQIATGSGNTTGGASVPGWNAEIWPYPFGEEAGNAPGVGFRDGTLRIVFWVTDAVGHNSSLYNYPYTGLTSPTAAAVVSELNAANIRVIGVNTNADDTESLEDQRYAAKGTNSRAPTSALESLGASAPAPDDTGACPLVFRTDSNNTAYRFLTGIQALIANAVFGRVKVSLTDDPTDAVDALASFCKRVEANPAAGQTAADQDLDGHEETYLNTGVGTLLGFTLVAKTNGTIAMTGSVQVFKANLVLLGDDQVVLGKRTICFIVPPSGS